MLAHSRFSDTVSWIKTESNTRAFVFNKMAFLNMMFVKITLIMVSVPYFWGQVSNKKGRSCHVERAIYSL